MTEKGSAQTEGLRCVYFNARSVVNKMDELRAWITTWKCDVIAITETWLSQGNSLSTHIVCTFKI